MKINKIETWLAATCLLVLLGSGCVPENPQSGQSSTQVHREIVIFAAASLTDVLREIGNAYEAETGIEPVFNFAGSNVLAQQIKASPRADVFLSASERWMDAVAETGRIVPETRASLLSNTLAVVAHPSSGWTLTTPADLDSLDFKFLAIGDPEAVPAGRYARQWLAGIQKDGSTLWDMLSARVSPAPDVRAALGQVEANADVIGIVYRTDFMAAKERVKLLLAVPVSEGPSISYAVARLAEAPHAEAASRFLEFLGSKAARDLFDQAGFTVSSPSTGGH